MRHGKKFNHLGRTAPHRKAMLANMASSLIISKRITTTVAKAKALRQYVEPLLTKSKEDTTHNRRIVFSYLKNKETIKELFGEVGAKIASRPGGYTRIIKLGSRLGDDAEMALIELVDYNENLLGEKSDKKKATTRRSKRGSKAKAEASDATEVKADQEKAEEPKKEAKSKKEEPQASKSDSHADAEEKKIEDKKSEDSDDKKEDA
jgi:large subunit ribosomal protein L17